MKDVSKIENSKKGTAGELLAVKFLKSKHYKILQVNYKNSVGEIDIIAQHKKQIVFVEVKARESLQYGRPVEAVDERKQNKIKTVAEMFLSQNKKTLVDVRFDVIEVLGDKILSHIVDAF